MKKMMKKLIKKIKELKIFQKTSCLVVVFMLLFSTFSVSVFAAEEGTEAADQSSETESITDVWTAVMDGIMDLIGSAQGVFYSSDVDFLEFGSPVIYSDLGLTLYPILNFPDVPIDSSIPITIIVGDQSLSCSLFIYDYNNDDPLLPGYLYSKVAVLVSSDGLMEPFAFYDICLGSSSNVLVPGWSCSYGESLDAIVSSSSGLTFIGTLAVLGVALAVILLLVYVVVSFIRLRG